MNRANIIVTRDVSEYRATIPHCVKKNDVVLEIGCAEGTTTRKIWEHCRDVIGIDKGKSILEAMKRHPEIRFERIDGFDLSSIRGLNKQFNKIYIDISGSRDPADVIRMIRKHEAVFKPELMVVKSSKLLNMLRRFIVWSDGNVDQ